MNHLDSKMNIASPPLVSIVTPVYNEEQYLAECIESVLSQTYQNWEYTIVDNCSTDKSLEIARHYAARDPRIHVHQNAEFLEMLANHNVAIRRISPASKYCKVVLADDRIFPGCLEQMVAVAEKYQSVGIVSAYEMWGQEIRIKGLPTEKTLVAGREACSQFLLGKLVLFGSQNSVLYRADLVRNRAPFYDTTNRYADFEACFALLSGSDLGFVHEVLTFSRPRPMSIGAISADIGANFGSLLDILFRYGGTCLTTEEYEQCLDRYLSQYYDFLGRRLLIEHNRDFWSYHKSAFAKAGIPFSHARVLKAAIGQVCRSVLSPKSTMDSVKRLCGLKKIRDRQTRKVVLAGAENPNMQGSATVNDNQITSSRQATETT